MLPKHEDGFRLFTTDELDFVAALMVCKNASVRVRIHSMRRKAPRNQVEFLLCGVGGENQNVDLYDEIAQLRVQYVNKSLEVEPTEYASQVRSLRSMSKDYMNSGRQDKQQRINGKGNNEQPARQPAEVKISR